MSGSDQGNGAAVILGDWGTSRLRLYLVESGCVRAEAQGAGIAELSTSPLEALSAAVAPWRERTQRVVLCGMAGSRNGLVEVPYLGIPVDLQQWLRSQRKLTAANLELSISPGLSTLSEAGVPDVIRGEETQVFGAMGRDSSLRRGRHLLVLPGTHSKWVQIDEGRIVAFNTYMTGELFALLSTHSTLLRAGSDQNNAEPGFKLGLARSREWDGRLAAALFETRSAQLVQARSQGWAREFLSGLLIGDEVRCALHRRNDQRSICLVGEPRLTQRYREALESAAHRVTELDGNRCAVDGLMQLACGREGSCLHEH